MKYEEQRKKMMEDRKKFLKKGAKYVEIVGFDPDKVNEEAYFS